MCARFSFTVRPDARWVRERFDAAVRCELPPPRWNIAPTDPVLAIAADEDGQRRTELLRWDLRGRRPPLINVRTETALKRPQIQRLLAHAHTRVLVLADGFYEWMHPEAPDQPKAPVRYFCADEPVFAFAGVRSREGCAIFTTTPNELVRPVHDRMPVILDDRAQESAWLDRGVDAHAAHALLDPLPTSQLRATPVSSRLNHVRAEGPDLWEPDPPAAPMRLF